MLHLANPRPEGGAGHARWTPPDSSTLHFKRKATLTEQAHDAGVVWCADNGCFSNRWDESAWWRFLEKRNIARSDLFATLPDVVGDAWQTGIKSLPWIEPVKALGYKVAWVAQDGQGTHPLPWHDIDCLFIGGTTEWKLARTRATSRSRPNAAASGSTWAVSTPDVAIATPSPSDATRSMERSHLRPGRQPSPPTRMGQERLNDATGHPRARHARKRLTYAQHRAPMMCITNTTTEGTP